MISPLQLWKIMAVGRGSGHTTEAFHYDIQHQYKGHFRLNVCVMSPVLINFY